MSSYLQLLLASTALLSTSLVSATFSATSKNNVVTYWGQGAYQERLLATCQNPNVDIINVGFVDVFPDQGPGGWPGTNFGNACWGDVYNNTQNVPTDLLKTCPYISEDVIACQQTYGKKIFLSIGGGNPNNYYIKTAASGKSFANFLWAAFGPVSATKSTVPRPWGNASVDGFDFDTENLINPAPQKDYTTSGYVAMINQLKNTLFPTDKTKSYYISGAPQCVIPDVHFTTILKTAWFDFLWIQFYNTAQCSARAAINKAQGIGSDNISYANWVKATSLNKNIRMSIGLPAATTAAIDPSYYLKTTEVQTLVKSYYSNSLFGGIMLWEATADQNNTICGSPYSYWMKTILNARAKGKNAVLKCSSKRDEIDSYAYSADPASSSAAPSGYPTSYSSSPVSSAAPSYSADPYSYPSSSVADPISSYVPYSGYSGTYGSDGTITVWETNVVTVTDSAACTSTPSGFPSVPAYSGSEVAAIPTYSSAAAYTPPSPTTAVATSYHVVTVVPVPASSVPTSSAAPYYAGAYNATSYGTAAASTGWPSSSAYPVPATGGTSMESVSLAGLMIACAAVAFLV